jgi:putative toxin-antitoxin system antitoxin component (TIGR02293 family)
MPAASNKMTLSTLVLYEKGLIIFGSTEEFTKWMSTPAFGLGNQKPKDLLNTITGINLITEELTRVEYGDLS